MVKRVPLPFVFLLLCVAARPGSTQPTPWFHSQDFVEHERDYPAGFAAGIVVEGSAAVRTLWALPALPLPDEVPSGPCLIYGATQIVAGGSTIWATGWWQVPVNDPPRYEPLGSGAAVYAATEIISITQTTNVFNSTIINTTTIVSITSTTNIFNATTVNATTVVVDRLVTERYEQNYVGDQSQAEIGLDYPAYEEGFEVCAITDPPISHEVELLPEVYYEKTLDELGRVISIVPMGVYRWYLQTTIRIRYVRAD